MDRPMDMAPPVWAPSRPQKPWLTLPSKQKVSLKQLKLMRITEQVGGAGHSLRENMWSWGTPAWHMSPGLSVDLDNIPWSVRGLHQRS